MLGRLPSQIRGVSTPGVTLLVHHLQGQSLASRADPQAFVNTGVASDVAHQHLFTAAPATKPRPASNFWKKLFSEPRFDMNGDSHWPVSMQACLAAIAPQPASTSAVPVATTDNGIRAFHQDTGTELKLEAQVIFEASWRKLEEKYKHQLRAPREIVWLNGAPGSGKGINTPYITELRGLSRAITVSSLLENNAEARAYIDRGDMLPDALVVDAVLGAIFDPNEADGVGVLVDGFPRTALQVDLLKLLHDKLQAFHSLYLNTPIARNFPRPSFKVMVLYVDEDTSVQRQTSRAAKTSKHNLRVKDAGAGVIREKRVTDADADKVRKRYAIFKANYNAILRLKLFFPFHLIDAMGTIDETRSQISRELRYQSSLDLAEYTYEAIRHLPLARDLARTARQQLVSRLDEYARTNSALFKSVIKVIDREVLPMLRKSGLSGKAQFTTRERQFTQHPVTIDMLIDVLSDRGFNVCHTQDEEVVPVKFDLQTGNIEVRRDVVHKFHFTFQSHEVRAAVKTQDVPSSASSSPSSIDEDESPEIKITQSFIPAHVDHSKRGAKPSSDFERQMGYEDGDDIPDYEPLLQRSAATY